MWAVSEFRDERSVSICQPKVGQRILGREKHFEGTEGASPSRKRPLRPPALRFALIGESQASTSNGRTFLRASSSSACPS